MEINLEELLHIDRAVRLRQASVAEIGRVQLASLRDHLRWSAGIPFYRELFAACDFQSDQIRELSDLASLPLTGREDLDRVPEKFGLQDQAMWRDIAVTSGTTGVPVVVPYTERDLRRLAFNEGVAFHSAGLQVSDRVLLTVTLDRCFIAGKAYYSGVTFLGASAIRSGPGQPARQWELIKRLQPTCLVGVPSFLAEIAEWGVSNNIDVAGSSIRTVVTIGEPSRKSDFSPTAVGQKLQDLWGATIHNSYGGTEIETAFGECRIGNGGHIHPELMVVEIVDDHGNPLAEGTPGEVVVTPLGVQGFPLVRFRTGDIARMYNTPCSCGWNTPRLGPVEGRLAQRLKCRGTTLYPETIFHALGDMADVQGAFIEVRSAADGADDVKVVVGTDKENPDRKQLEDQLQAHLRFRPVVEIRSRAEVATVMSGDGGRKAKKFFDFRS